MPKIIRLTYDRRYVKRGILIETRWFILRVYLPVLPSFTFWRR